MSVYAFFTTYKKRICLFYRSRCRDLRTSTKTLSTQYRIIGRLLLKVCCINTRIPKSHANSMVAEWKRAANMRVGAISAKVQR